MRAARRLRAVLGDAGYDAPTISAALRPAAGDADGSSLVDRRELAVHRLRLNGREDALALLIRLFLLEDAVDSTLLDRSLGDAGPLAAAGVVRERGDETVATVRLVPHDDLLLASDRADSGAGAYHVPGAQRPSLTLSHLTVRRAVSRALDLGTGLGVQALLLARHAEHVVATDVSERALAFAAFNAALNEVTTIELRHGSFFEPVEGERFGLAVCNPPYVVSPSLEAVFRDGGLERDGVSEHVVRTMPSVLEDEGFATMMVSWAVEGPDAAAAPLAWLDAGGCDALLLHTASEDPLTTAAAWNRELRDDPRRYAARVEEWVDYYSRQGIAALAYGAVVLRRRRGGAPWRATVALPAERLGPASAQLERMFRAHDLMAADDADPVLLAARVTITDSAAVHTTSRLRDRAWVDGEPVLSLDDGIGIRAELDAATLEVVRALDGRRPLAETLESLATGDLARRDAGVALVRRLLELGYATATTA